MTTAVTRVFAPPLVAGAPPLVRALRGDRRLHRRACAPRSPSALGPARGPQRVLARLILAAVPAPAGATPGGGARCAPRTRRTGTGRTLGVPAWSPRHGLSLRPGDRPVDAVQGAGVCRDASPDWRPGAGKKRHALGGPLGQPRARHSPQGDGQRAQARAVL